MEIPRDPSSYPLERENRILEQYKFSCEICGCYPELKYLKQFTKGELLIDLSSISNKMLEVVCHAIAQLYTPFLIEITRKSNGRQSDTGKDIK